MDLGPDMISALVTGLAWLCGCASALVGLTWKVAVTSERVMNKLESIDERVTALELQSND